MSKMKESWSEKGLPLKERDEHIKRVISKVKERLQSLKKNINKIRRKEREL